MNSRNKFVYELDFVTGDIEAKIDRLAQRLQRSLQVGVANASGGESQVAVAQARAQQAQVTATARAESNERSAVARAEAREREQVAKTATTQITEAEKRLTAQTKAEIREREMAARQAARAQVGSSVRPGGISMGQIGGFLTTGVAGYGVAQVAGMALEAGKLGAENVRLARSYEQLAEGAGLAGDALLNKLSKATQQTVTEQKLMASTNLMLAAAQESQIAVSEEQIATLAKFARLRSTQLTQNGRPMSTEEAYSRLITGTIKRETELLDELGLSTKQLADQLGVDVSEVNNSVESLLGAITQVAEIEIARFGEPVLDEAAKIEQAATRIEESQNRIRAALSGPSAWAYETGAYAIEEMTFANNNRYKEDLFSDRKRMADMFEERNPLFGGDSEYKRMAELLRGATAAMEEGKAGADALGNSVMALAVGMADSAFVTDEQRAKLLALEAQLRVTSTDGIVLADTNREIGNSAEEATRKLFKMADGLYYLSEAGSKVVAPQIGPQLGYAWNREPNIHAVEGAFGGTLLGSALQGPDTLQGELGSAWRRRQEEDRAEEAAALKENDRLVKQGIAEQGRAWKSMISDVHSGLRKAADEFKSQLESIPGLLGNSQVTEAQMEEAKWGIAQNFPDDFRRRLADEVLNGVDYADIDPMEAWGRAGIDAGLPDEAKVALFNRAWDDSTLFADPLTGAARNLDLINQDAVYAEMRRREQSKVGRQNLMGMYGLGEDSQGAYFKDIGSFMADGLTDGAQVGLAEFGQKAVTGAIEQLRSDYALQQYEAAGAELGGALFNGVVAGATGSDIVSAIASEVLRMITKQYEQP